MKRLVGLAALAVAISVIASQHRGAAQTSPTSGGSIEPAIIEDLVVANRILADQGVLDGQFGKALAETLGDRNVVLMRGHGEVVAATSLQMVVLRGIYTEINARLQMQAIMLGGPLTYLDLEEGKKNEANLEVAKARSWELWKRAVLEKMPTK
jgi:ribulose-5-phosphate 4-epimerase/fuculose-1-phosphate aldolase